MNSTVYIVDDDAAIRRAMGMLLKSIGLQYKVYESALQFLDGYQGRSDDNGCLVLDIRMPEMDGLELQRRLAQQGSTLPIIFITGHGDIPMAVEAMQNGAVDFIQKPVRDQDLLDRIKDALVLAEERQNEIESKSQVLERIGDLTSREREVFDLVVTGKANKVVAHELGVSQRTIEIHRARVMEKMAAKSLAQLVRMHIDSQA